MLLNMDANSVGLLVQQGVVVLFCKKMCMATYRTFKTVFESEKYFEFVDINVSGTV